LLRLEGPGAAKQVLVAVPPPAAALQAARGLVRYYE
jgi:hypothetical protein